MKSTKDSRLVQALRIVAEESREDYSREKETITNALIKVIKEEYKIRRKEVLTLIREEIDIPTTIFSKELGRNERTIWTAYQKANEKMRKPLEIKKAKMFLPISIFKDERLTILESIIIYLKTISMKYVEIEKMLNRDQRNIWITHSRAIKKIKNH